MSQHETTRRDLIDAKTILSTLLPAAPGVSSRTDEAIAASLGFRTHAALLAATERGGVAAPFDPDAFAQAFVRSGDGATSGIARSAAVQAFARVLPRLEFAGGDVVVANAVRDVARARNLAVWSYPQLAHLIAGVPIEFDASAVRIHEDDGRLVHGPSPTSLSGESLGMASVHGQITTIMQAIPTLSPNATHVAVSFDNLDATLPKRLQRLGMDAMPPAERVGAVLEAFRSSRTRIGEEEGCRIADFVAREVRNRGDADLFVQLVDEFLPPVARMAAWSLVPPLVPSHHAIDFWYVATRAFDGDVDDFDPGDRPFRDEILTARLPPLEPSPHILGREAAEDGMPVRHTSLLRIDGGRRVVPVSFEQDIPAMQRLAPGEIEAVKANTSSKFFLAVDPASDVMYRTDAEVEWVYDSRRPAAPLVGADMRIVFIAGHDASAVRKRVLDHVRSLAAHEHRRTWLLAGEGVLHKDLSAIATSGGAILHHDATSPSWYRALYDGCWGHDPDVIVVEGFNTLADTRVELRPGVDSKTMRTVVWQYARTGHVVLVPFEAKTAEDAAAFVARNVDPFHIRDRDLVAYEFDGHVLDMSSYS